jgi:hypothetical protein
MIATLSGTYRQTVFMHEVVHAIFDTAGYYELSENEDMVDRISVLLTQMLSTMK